MARAVSGSLKLLVLAAFMGGTSLGVWAQAPVNSVSRPEAAMGAAVLHFSVTDAGFRTFRDVASHRQSARLDVLPGFPAEPTLDQAAAELTRDAGTVERLARGSLTPRDYILTGWDLILAHDPEDWGLDRDRLTAEMRRNVEFVRSHAQSVNALLESG
jgi:hypothetical protein